MRNICFLKFLFYNKLLYSFNEDFTDEIAFNKETDVKC